MAEDGIAGILRVSKIDDKNRTYALVLEDEEDEDSAPSTGGGAMASIFVHEAAHKKRASILFTGAHRTG